MLETLISSKTRIKLLLKFFLNSKATSYLRGLEAEFGDSSNAIRVELNRFEKAGMLTSYLEGNKKFFRANVHHPLYQETHNILLKYIGFDQIIDNVIERLGDVSEVFVTGAFAQGLDDEVIELVFIGNVNQNYLLDLITKAEKLIQRNIQYRVFQEGNVGFTERQEFEHKSLLLWKKD